MPNYIKIIFTVFFLLAIANLAYLDTKIFLEPQNQELPASTVGNGTPEQESSQPTPQVINIDKCGTDCQKVIDEKIEEALKKLPKATTTKIVEKETTPKTSQISYVPVGSSLTTNSTDWKTIEAGAAYVDKKEYGTNLTVTWEASLKTSHASGKVFARLYDDTHTVAVAGSEISSTFQTSTTIVSGNLSLWEGKNLYKVQVKSLDGQDVTFDSGKIKIVSQ